MSQINEISKVFLQGETLESSELNEIVLQINSTIRKLNTIESNLDNHEYDVSIPITNIYCRTKKGMNAINFFPQADAKRDELFEEISNCSTTQGIKYNTTFSTVTLSENADLMNGVWTSYPQGVNELLPHEWEVSYKKLEDNSIMYMFGPVLRSNYGYNGADGDGVQYIYKLFDHELSDIERTNNTPIRPENPNNNGEYIPYGWTDDPQSPTKDYPYEYVATLKRINSNWGQFEKISLWSTYTEDGSNGDFLIRAFCRFTPTSNKLTPNKPIGGTYENPLPGSNDDIQWYLSIPQEDNNNKGPIWTSTRIFKGTGLATEWSNPTIEADSSELDIEYSSNLEKPDLNTLRTIPKTPHPSNNIWHDPSENDLDLSSMVWRAERKIKNGQYNGEWVITKITGLKGSFKSIVFRRFKPTMQQLVPPTPTGGTYNNPIPDGGLWLDGIPSGNSKDNGPIWASTKIFLDDGTQSNWSTPLLLSDSENLDIEFSPGIGEEHSQPANPTGDPFSNRESQGWYDPSSVNFDSLAMAWRAERKVNNGQYVGNWTVTRIVGEKGDPGYRGDFVSRVFCRSSSQPEIPTGGTYDNPIPTDVDLQGNLIWSDGIPTIGPGTIYTSSRKFYGNPEHEEDNWSEPAIEADSTTLDIEYSDSVILPDSSTLRQTPGANHPINTGVNWYDPSNIPANTTIIWRAERKISGTEYDGDWVITKILGEEGPAGRRGGFKSCVFKRSNSVLNDFSNVEDGANYDSPVPTGWNDGIPSGNEVLWMAVSKFTGNGDEHSNWTVTQLTDSVDLDIEFSPNENCPAMALEGTVFSHPINNYEPNGNPPQITQDRKARNNAGWFDASNLPNESIIWRAERKIHNLLYEGDWVISKIAGEKGETAALSETQQQDLDAAGLQIVVTPLNIILDLNDILSSNTDDKIDDITASIIVYDRNGNALGNDKYQIKTINNNPVVEFYATDGPRVSGVLLPLSPVTNYVEIDGANLTNPKSVKIKNLPITTTTTNGTSSYTYTYNKGYIKIILTIPVGNSTRDVKIDIPWYLNKLGERETKIKGDIAETYLSRDIFTNDHTDKTIKLEFDAYINQSAKGTLEEYSLITTNALLNVPTKEEFSTYLKTATENLSALSKSITGTNLITDNGWCKEFSTISGKKRTVCSPFVYLKPGKYIFSTYVNSNADFNNNIKLEAKQSTKKLDPLTLLTNYSNENWKIINYNGVLESNIDIGYEGEYYPSITSNPKYVRMYFVFTIEASGILKEGYYTFHIALDNSNFTTCIRPLLELCLDTNTNEKPTTWTPGPQDFSSEIKQTAEEITSEVKGIKYGNLLTGTLTGTNWKSNSSISFSGVNNVTVDSDEWIQGKSEDTYIISPSFKIKNGLKYTVSFEVVSGNTPVYVRYDNNGTPVLLYTLTAKGDLRQSATFTGTANSEGKNVYLFISKAKIRHPQVEFGEEASNFNAGDTEVSSKIKQTADEITSQVVGLDSISEINQTLDTISLTVKNIQESGENLILNGAFLEGTSGTLNWSDWGTPSTREIVTANGKKWMHIVSTADKFLGFQQEHSSDFGIKIIPGEKYTLSFKAYSANDTKPTVCMGFHWKTSPNAANVALDWYEFKIDSTPKTYKQTITIPTTNSGISYFCAMVGHRTESILNFYMTEIKFEKGEVATAWTPTRYDTYSQLRLTGIVIDGNNSRINLKADKVVFLKSDGSTNENIRIDTTTGELHANKIHAINGEFEGTITAKNLFNSICFFGGGSDAESPMYSSHYYYILYKPTIGYSINGYNDGEEPDIDCDSQDEFTATINFWNNLVEGKYYTSEEINMLLEANTVNNVQPIFIEYVLNGSKRSWRKCTGDANIVYLIPARSGEDSYKYNSPVILPRAKDYPGKIIELSGRSRWVDEENMYIGCVDGKISASAIYGTNNGFTYNPNTSFDESSYIALLTGQIYLLYSCKLNNDYYWINLGSKSVPS